MGLHNDASACNSLWREPDGMFWAKVRWYIIPEETAAGRQPHNLRRELYRTNDLGDIEVIILFRVYSWLFQNLYLLIHLWFKFSVLMACADGNDPKTLCCNVPQRLQGRQRWRG